MQCQDPRAAPLLQFTEVSRTPGKPSSGADARAPDPNDITRGSVGRHLVRLAVPSALTNLLSFSTTFIDVIWLGRVSPSAIAAVATFNYFWFMLALLNQMIGQGSVPLIARSYGAGRFGECRRVFGQTFSFKVIVASVVAVLGLCFMRLAFSLFGAKDEVLDQALIYGGIMFIATPIMFSTFTLKTGFRAIGDMRTLLRVSAITAVLNFILDPILIFEQVYIGPFPALGIAEPLLTFPGAGMGIAGAAWGTAIAFSVVFIQSMYYFLTGRTFLTMRLRYFFQPSLDTARRIVSIGMPPALGNAARHFGELFVGAAINSFGTTVFAGQGVNQMLMRGVRMAVMGINISSMTMVGQNLGALERRRAVRSAYMALLVTAGLLVAAGGLLYWGAPAVARLFVPGTDAESLATAEWATRILRINCFVLLSFGLVQVARSPFEGSGDTKPSFYVIAATTWGIQVPLTALGVYVWRLEDPSFIWWVEAGAYGLGFLALLLLIRRGRWAHKEV